MVLTFLQLSFIMLILILNFEYSCFLSVLEKSLINDSFLKINFNSLTVFILALQGPIINFTGVKNQDTQIWKMSLYRITIVYTILVLFDHGHNEINPMLLKKTVKNLIDLFRLCGMPNRWRSKSWKDMSWIKVKQSLVMFILHFVLIALYLHLHWYHWWFWC